MLEFLVQLEDIGQEQTSGSILRDNNFKPDEDAEQLREAVKGLGTDEDLIIRILSGRTNKQRQEIKNSYKQLYGRELDEDLDGDLSGDFNTLVQALLIPPRAYDAKCLRDATKGIGTNETALTEILCSRDNREIRQIRTIYKKEYEIELQDALESDTHGDFKRLMVSLCNGDRDESTDIDMREAVKDAEHLYNAGEGRAGTDEEEFNKIFCRKSYAQLRATFSEYYRLGSKDISEAIDEEFSGDMKQALLAIVHVARSRPGFFAMRLHKAMRGLGTDDHALIRLIVSRSEDDMTQVKKSFNLIFKASLDEFIEDDTSGDYRKLLLELL